MAPSVHVVTVKSSSKLILAKKKSCPKHNGGQKQKDKPKRPLSAYNFFFQHERDRMLRSTNSPYGLSHEKNHCTIGINPSERTTNKSKKERPPPHGKIGFAELAKIIGQRWKSLSQDERSYYDQLAENEKDRYNRDLSAWHQKKDAAFSSSAEKEKESGKGGNVHSPMPQLPKPPQAQPLFSAAMNVAHVGPEQIYSMRTLPMMASPHVEQSTTPQMVPVEFSQPIADPMVSQTNESWPQLKPMPLTDRNQTNACWPVQRAPDKESIQLDLDISRMIDLLMSSEAFEL